MCKILDFRTLDYMKFYFCACKIYIFFAQFYFRALLVVRITLIRADCIFAQEHCAKIKLTRKFHELRYKHPSAENNKTYKKQKNFCSRLYKKERKKFYHSHKKKSDYGFMLI